MHLGLDFDNTIVRYDGLFHRCALERGLIPAYLPVSKGAVRAHLWAQPDGNTPWTELQGTVYGTRMAEAEPFEGVEDFLRYCRREGVRCSIISHKDEYPALGPRVNLREAALHWMEQRGFFDPGNIGLSRDAVVFEGARDAKIARIREFRCTHFIDDLIEVLRHRDFPPSTVRWLFDPARVSDGEQGVEVFGSWHEVRREVEEILS
jgi:hypothetical protein